MDKSKLAKRAEDGSKAEALLAHFGVLEERIVRLQELVTKAMQNGTDDYATYREYVGKYQALEMIKKMPEEIIKKGESARKELEKLEDNEK